MTDRFHKKQFGGKINKTFSEWLVAPQDNDAKDEAMKEIWNESPYSVTSSTYRSLREVNVRLGMAARDRRTGTMKLIASRVAAALLPVLLVLGAYFAFLSDGPEIQWAKLDVPYGETLNHRLADGTNVWLNAGSVLEYPVKFRGMQREVRLLGEGFFAVASNDRKPFTVRTDNMKIRVTGTEFNVSCYDDRDIEQVTVLNGGVEVVTRDGKSYGLSPDRQLTFRKDGSATYIEDVEASAIVNWMNSGLVFNGNTHREILNELCRRYNLKIEADQSVFTGAQYCVRFVNGEPLEHILDVISNMTGVPHKYENGVLTAGSL